MIQLFNRKKQWNNFINIVIYVAMHRFTMKENYYLCDVLVEVFHLFPDEKKNVFKLQKMIDEKEKINARSLFAFTYPVDRFRNKKYLQLRINWLNSLKK